MAMTAFLHMWNIKKTSYENLEFHLRGYLMIIMSFQSQDEGFLPHNHVIISQTTHFDQEEEQFITFEGMQPTFRQVPPRVGFFSTQTV